MTGALHVLQFQLSPPPASSLALIKSRMETSGSGLLGLSWKTSAVECLDIDIISEFSMCTATRTSSHSPIGPSFFVYLD